VRQRYDVARASQVHGDRVGQRHVDTRSPGRARDQHRAGAVLLDQSSGTTTIAFLQVGGTVVIAKPTAIAPNTTINVGVVSLVLNEQIPVTGPDKGLTVNAVHIKVNALGAAKVDMILASSESDIGNCP